MLISLPHILEEEYPYSREKQAMFSTEQARNNLSLLESGLGLGFEEVPYTSTLFAEYAQVLEHTRDALWITDDSDLQRDANVNNLTRTTPIALYDILSEELIVSGENRELIFLSDSHTTSGPILGACKKINPDTRIGVLCVDAHADIYDPREPLWKGNVFSRLILNGTISQILFLGVPEFRKRSIYSQVSQRIRKRIGFADWAQFTVGPDRWLQRFAGEVDEVFISVDLDGLDTRSAKYTAMEYCPFTPLLNLGTSDGSRFKGCELEQYLQSVIRPPGRIQLDGLQTHKNMYLIGEGGCPEPVFREILDLSSLYLESLGVRIGINCGGSRVVGDIVELFGIDLLCRTANAVQSIAKALHQCSKGG